MVGGWTWNRVIVAGALVVAGACGGKDRGGTAGGEAAAGEVTALNYEVTPERYQRWVVAQRALDATPSLSAPPKIDPMRPNESEIGRAVTYLENDPRARAALARAGISARDYVLTTVALDQALVAAASPAPSGTAAASTQSGTSPGNPGTKSAPAGNTPALAARRAEAAAVPPRPRITGAPAANVELVRRNRGDLVRVLRTMRFRVSEPAAEDVVDTAVTRSDSITVGKDVTVKWDVTVRRRRDSTSRVPARRDSTRPDST